MCFVASCVGVYGRTLEITATASNDKSAAIPMKVHSCESPLTLNSANLFTITALKAGARAVSSRKLFAHRYLKRCKDCACLRVSVPPTFPLLGTGLLLQPT